MTWLRRNAPLILTHVGAWMPLLVLAWDWFGGHLSPNPIRDATLRTGKTALVLLALSLACTPVRIVFGWNSIIKLRKWLGLYAAAYAGVHFLIFVGLDYGWDLQLLRTDLFQKRYALAGLASGLILLALALTSTRGWKRRLGKRWPRLHRLAYVAGLLAIVHYVWLTKSHYSQPLLFGLILGVLLLIRVPPIRGIARRFQPVFKKLLARLSPSASDSQDRGTATPDMLPTQR